MNGKRYFLKLLRKTCQENEQLNALSIYNASSLRTDGFASPAPNYIIWIFYKPRSKQRLTLFTEESALLNYGTTEIM
jgi:hypothetical protein